MNECEHDRIDAERAYDERPEGTNPLGIIGTCRDCGAAMRLEGDPDEDGHPTWEETYSPAELAMIWDQSGGSVTRA